MSGAGNPLNCDYRDPWHVRSAASRAIPNARQAVLSERKSQRKAEAFGERRVLVIDLVGVAKLQVEKRYLVVFEVRTGMPSAAVQLEHHRARYLESRDVRKSRLGRRIVESFGRRNRHQP